MLVIVKPYKTNDNSYFTLMHGNFLCQIVFLMLMYFVFYFSLLNKINFSHSIILKGLLLDRKL